ncbi:MAG: hypothetical protein OEN56_07570 [Gemmatimonadota bacterium]|nr:hypothetical protein [Gemmatimonadota bacterium]
MNQVAQRAETELHSAAHPALRISELLELVADVAGHSMTPAALRSILEARPDRFRILESWGWRHQDGNDPRKRERPFGDVWVVAVRSPERPPDAPQPATRLRESVRWVALGMDGRSRVEVSRWCAIAMAERATRAAVAHRAA